MERVGEVEEVGEEDEGREPRREMEMRGVREWRKESGDMGMMGSCCVVV
jgi:hypothetical protein